MTWKDRNISAAPLTHLYGLYNFHVALCAGAANVLLPIFNPADLAKMIEKTKSTTVFLGPPHAASLLNTGLIDAHDFSSVRFSMFSGSACPSHLLKNYKDEIAKQNNATRIGQLWGMTEIAGLGSTHPLYGKNRHGSIGCAMPYCELKIIDVDIKLFSKSIMVYDRPVVYYEHPYPVPIDVYEFYLKQVF